MARCNQLTSLPFKGLKKSVAEQTALTTLTLRWAGRHKKVSQGRIKGIVKPSLANEALLDWLTKTGYKLDCLQLKSMAKDTTEWHRDTQDLPNGSQRSLSY